MLLISCKLSTFVGGIMLPPREETALPDGISVRLGDVDFILHCVQENRTVNVHHM